MDVPRTAPRRSLRRPALALAALLALVGVTLGLRRLRAAAPSLERGALWIDTVRRGPMLREVQGPGTLVPEEIRWITAASAGRVERVLLRPGAAVTAESVLVELTNPDVELQALEAARQVGAAEAELVNLQSSLQTARLAQESTMASLRSQAGDARRRAAADEELARRGYLAPLEVAQSRDRAGELGGRLTFEERRLSVQSQGNAAQVAAQRAQLERLRAIAAFRRREVEGLKVRAGAAGVLQELPLQPGQSVTLGTLLAKVARPDRLKAELRVPETLAKDVLLSILGLLDAPSGGRYTLGGEAVAGLNAERRAVLRNRQIGFIFQSFNLIGDLTVQQNVELPLTYRGMAAPERRRRAEEALQRVGLAHRGRHMPSQLSGGQQQRVAVARALAGDPLILLADEPTGNLDSKNGDVVMDLLRELHRGGATLCMVTHNPEYARHASRSIHLFDGRIVDERAERGAEPPGARGAYARLARLPPPRPATLPVEPWVRRVAELEERLPIAVEAGPPLAVRGDADQLDQALINLVRNAADAALETGGAVRLTWRRDGDAVEVLVLDEGPGVAATANLFVPFFTTKPAGSGIGLALSRQVAEAHEGALTLENRADRPGCVARLRLPIDRSAAPAPAARG